MPGDFGITVEGYEITRRRDCPLPWSVYDATEFSSGRPARLTVLPEPGSMSAERRRSLLDWFAEAGFQAQRLSSPAMPPVLGFRSDPYFAWVATEAPSGRTLREAIEEGGPFTIQRAMAVSGRIAAGLAPAHRAGWAHGWLNGETVWVRDDDGAQIVDLGLGIAVAPMTGGGERPFASRPGLLSSDPRRMDLQCLGLIMTWMLAGRLPDPVGVPRAEAFPKGTPSHVVREVRALIDPESEDCLTAEEWQRFAGAGGEEAMLDRGTPFYETAARPVRAMPRWLRAAGLALPLAGLLWLAARPLLQGGQLPAVSVPQAAEPSGKGEQPAPDQVTFVRVGPVSEADKPALLRRLEGLNFETYVVPEPDGEFIQVAALANRERAEEIRRELEAKGLSVRLENGPLPPKKD